MSEHEQNIINHMEQLFAKQRDFPQTETLSKLLYSLQGDMKVHTEILERIESRIGGVEEQTKKTNGRVNDLEKWKENLMGKITVVVAVVSFAISKLF
jgi:predicted nuclease with TOPRIM domain